MARAITIALSFLGSASLLDLALALVTCMVLRIGLASQRKDSRHSIAAQARGRRAPGLVPASFLGLLFASWFLIQAMADQQQHGDVFSTDRMPLDTFSRNVPPGWRPGVARYPIRRYKQLLSLWWMQTELPEHQCGAAIAGRLRGTAFQYAFSLSLSLSRAS